MHFPRHPLTVAITLAWMVVLAVLLGSVWWHERMAPTVWMVLTLTATAVSMTTTLVWVVRECTETLGRVFVAGYRIRMRDERRRLHAVD